MFHYSIKDSEGINVNPNSFEESLKNIFSESGLEYNLLDSRKSKKGVLKSYCFFKENDFIGIIDTFYSKNLTSVVFSGEKEKELSKKLIKSSNFIWRNY